jgi:hypothetical protein
MNRYLLLAILGGGILAGTLDIGAAAPSRPPAGISKFTKDVLAMLGFGLIISYAVYRASFQVT